MKNKTVPVLLLTGYLGSGKTTLVNHILTNEKGIKFAVIVNDLGEVNIDADLIQKGGIVGQKDDSLVALQNGCICCTLKMDLIQQINEIIEMGKFDYIVIEASGICEPEPIAQTICMMPRMDGANKKEGTPKLDCVCTVVDALRLKSEFNCGDALSKKNLDEDDLENLIIQQIEFCNIILLNKANEVTADDLRRIRKILRAIQPEAKIIDCNYAEVDLSLIINTHLFDFENVATSATWVKELERPTDEIVSEECDNHFQNQEEDEEDEHALHSHEHNHEHGSDHHHHHHEDEGEAEEYGISTFVYYRRPPFDLNKFDRFVGSQWSKNIIRTKGVCYFKENPDMSYLFEQAGVQKKLTEAGKWFATAPEEELIQFMQTEPGLLNDWDEKYGDRMQKIVFIGQNMNKEEIIRGLDDCLDK